MSNSTKKAHEDIDTQKRSMSPRYRLKSSPINLEIQDDLLCRLLKLRGISNDEIGVFLKPDFETGLHDPFLLKNMQKVVDRILLAIKQKEHILIYSDYDADGLPGAAIFHDFFTTISYPSVSYVRPDRHQEGFGLHPHIIDHFFIESEDNKKPATLLITIDCGITDVEPVNTITEHYKNVDIIITDHHLPGPQLPEVFAIINPKLPDCTYPEKMLCGAGVVYKIVCALIKTLKTTPPEDSLQILGTMFSVGYEKWLLDLVGFATLSDMVPLRGENRLFAYYGLIVLSKTKRPGFQALAKINNLNLRSITEDDVVFTFSPRINVASRLADAKIAFDLLTARDFDTAMAHAKQLHSINQKRKTMVAQISKQAHGTVISRDLAKGTNGIIVIGNPDWKPPVLGLVAQAMVKAYNKPTFVWGRSDDGVYKGSVRSVEGVDIVKLMNHVDTGVFINRGGHAQSGGFSVHSDSIFDIDVLLEKSFQVIYGKSSGDSTEYNTATHALVHEVDSELSLAEVSHMICGTISKLAPYGMDNPKPLFAFPNCSIVNKKMFGKAQDHLEVICTDDSLARLGGKTVKAIQFFYKDSVGASDIQLGEIDDSNQSKQYTIIGHIEKNNFMGANDIRLRVVDIY